MLVIPGTVRIYLCREPTDMRKSFDGLAAMVQDYLGEDPLSGHLFAFRNRRGDRVKILFFDRSGYCLWYKRLEEGTFALPSGDGLTAKLSAAELTLMLEGIDLAGARQRRRYCLPSVAMESRASI